MESSQFFGLAMIVYILAAAFYVGLFLFKNTKVGLVGMVLAVSGLSLHWPSPCAGSNPTAWGSAMPH